MKNISKRIIAFLSGVLLGLSCSLCLVVAADSTSSSGQDILDDTRYSAIGFGTLVDIISMIAGIADNAVSQTELRDTLIQDFAKKVAENSIQNTIDNANKTYGTAENYTIQPAFCIMGKRKLNYPDGKSEVQTCFVYIDRNVEEALPQQFGQYSVAPNTVFLVRDTSWGGVIPLSIPITQNNIRTYTYNANGGLSLGLENPPNNTFVYDTPTGRESVGFRHGGSPYEPLTINFINNSTNTIVINKFLDYYNSSPSGYSYYISDGVPDNFEAFIGSGYLYEDSQGLMFGSRWDYLCPFYITTAYFNGTSEFGTTKLNNTYSTNNNIDPSKPPAYILPDSNPLSAGQTINNNTINNYNDYGITSIDGELELSPDILAGALGGLITPDFEGALNGVFGLQPQIGLGFDTPLDLNLPDIVGDFLDSITVYPPSTGWEPPSYPAVNTSAYIPATYPTIPTNTLPSGYGEGVGEVLTNGWDIADSLGITAILVPIIIMLLLWRFTGKG